MEKIVSLAKRRGFVFPGSEIYGGLAGTWDYGPLGVRLKENIKHEWWRHMLREDRIYPLDAAILMNSKTWEASGHIEHFSDPLVECNNCNYRDRPDQLVENELDLATVRKEFLVIIDDIADKIDSDTNKAKDLMKSARIIIQDRLKDNSLSPEEISALQSTVEMILNQSEYLLKKSGSSLQVKSFIIKEVSNSLKYHGIVLRRYLNAFVRCPNCGARKWGIPKLFQMMFKTHAGPVENASTVVYLRPETAQGIFTNFKNVVDSFRPVLPFGIAQIGKAFRNEITPRNFLFRAREFEQMELEYFCHPEKADEYFTDIRNMRMEWFLSLGIRKDNIRFRDHAKDELAHYSRAATDIEYRFGLNEGGFSELEGIANRGDFDLSNHAKHSGIDLKLEGIMPHVIEPSLGLDRAFLAFLMDAYYEESVGSPTSSGKSDFPGKRVVLKLHPRLAPLKVAVFPLLANKPQLVEKARSIYVMLREAGSWGLGAAIAWDDRGNIGKRYFAQDEIGTPWCVTVDFQTLEDDTVTVRDRDTAKQERISISELQKYFREKLI